ncbi:MAG: phage minor capsid protein [Clostridiales bacterium]|nr:phage minor capsid protein [Clostridiales bacterium]
MDLADRGLNPQAEAIEEAQTEIRVAVRDGYLARKSKAAINTEIQTIIRRKLKSVKNADLRSAAVQSLNAFAERQYNTYLREFGALPTYILLLSVLINDAPTAPSFERAATDIQRYAPVTYETGAHGVPLQEYSRDYFKRNVAPVLERLANENALDPDDVSGRNSLRNRAEMEVRYARHLDEIEALRAAGIKLVTSSVHADCSDRCYEWQGRVYSLDGTSGTTEDGKPYVPIETATDVYYTTKAGKVYKNGLFGFNCRHYLVTYTPNMVIPHVSRETQKKEQTINTRQRELERRVREQREKALMFRDIDRNRYLVARRRAIETNKEYIQYSKDNGRAYYPSRTKLL